MSLAHAPVVAAVHDLLFASRIRAVARQTGTEVTLPRSAAELTATAMRAQRVIIDIEARWLDVPAMIRSLKAARPELEIVAFGSHVLGERLQEARAAGADRVLARSAFMKELPALLGG